MGKEKYIENLSSSVIKSEALKWKIPGKSLVW